MKKYLLYFSLFILHISLCSAQDTIVLRTGIKTGVKVISVGDFVVFNQPPNHQDQRMENSKVAYIKYADGYIYTVNRPEIGPTPKSEIYQYNDSAYTLFSITTDIAQYTLFQPNIGFEYRIVRPLTIGANAGLVFPSAVFAVNPLADGQFTFPGTVYRGYALRFYLKFYPSVQHKGYFCIQGVVKSVSFNDVSFTDQYNGDPDATFPSTNTYTMSEHTNIIGVEMLHGNGHLGPNKYLDIDMFYGFGIHLRFRNYTISNQAWGTYGSSGADYQGGPIAHDGTYNNTLTLPTLIFGFRVGFNYLKKK